jgi:hypothetical protein
VFWGLLRFLTDRAHVKGIHRMMDSILGEATTFENLLTIMRNTLLAASTKGEKSFFFCRGSNFIVRGKSRSTESQE